MPHDHPTRNICRTATPTRHGWSKSLDQRAKTILKVAREIVRQQDAFLVLGVQHLKPINLKTVADAISMHESTVSRVTSNKYMATPRGIFEFKYFFTTAIASAEEGGQAHSSESVRHRIKELIEGEKPAEVLSDDMIVEILSRRVSTLPAGLSPSIGNHSEYSHQFSAAAKSAPMAAERRRRAVSNLTSAWAATSFRRDFRAFGSHVSGPDAVSPCGQEAMGGMSDLSH